MMDLLAAGSPLEHVVDHTLFGAGGWALLTNHMVMLITAALIMILAFPVLARPYLDGKMVPTGSRNFFEAIILFVRNDIAKPVLGDDTDRYMPLLWTLFFFIAICNILGLIPFDAIQTATIGRVVHHFHPIYGTATSNFYVTATLAVIVFVVIQYSAFKSGGVGGWAHHLLGGAPWFLAPIMVPVEILGMLIKPFALAVRLAANMTAGHILIAVLIGFVPATWANFGAGAGFGVGVISVVASVAIMVLELFVALLQAYLFTFLTALFVSQVISHHDDGHGHHETEGNELGEPIATREGDFDHGHKPAHA